MSYSNKIFNVNGIGKEELFNCLKLALSDLNIYGYRIDNENGLEIFLSKSLLPPDDAIIVNDKPSPLDEEISIIWGYLEKMKDTVAYQNEDAMDEEMALSDTLRYHFGWRVFTQLENKDGKSWWNHNVWVRPSYVLQ